jgi:hypothetical protein
MTLQAGALFSMEVLIEVGFSGKQALRVALRKDLVEVRRAISSPAPNAALKPGSD